MIHDGREAHEHLQYRSAIRIWSAMAKDWLRASQALLGATSVVLWQYQEQDVQINNSKMLVRGRTEELIKERTKLWAVT